MHKIIHCLFYILPDFTGALLFVCAAKKLCEDLVKSKMPEVSGILFYLLLLLFRVRKGKAQLKEEQIMYRTGRAAYQKKYEHIKQSWKILDHLSHNLSNHLFNIKLFLQEEEYSKALGYIDNVSDSIKKMSHLTDSGNLLIDSIINAKIQEARSGGIQIGHKIAVPAGMNVNEADLMLVISILMDCTIQSLSGRVRKKTVQFIMQYDKNRLFIWICYPCDGSRRNRYHHKAIWRRHRRAIKKALNPFRGKMLTEKKEDMIITGVIMYL